jgi:hypothetical protein
MIDPRSGFITRPFVKIKSNGLDRMLQSSQTENVSASMARFIPSSDCGGGRERKNRFVFCLPSLELASEIDSAAINLSPTPPSSPASHHLVHNGCDVESQVVLICILWPSIFLPTNLGPV